MKALEMIWGLQPQGYFLLLKIPSQKPPAYKIHVFPTAKSHSLLDIHNYFIPIKSVSEVTSCIPSLNLVYWPFLGPWAPFGDPEEDQAGLRNQVSLTCRCGKSRWGGGLYSLVLQGPDPSHPDSTLVWSGAESLQCWGEHSRWKNSEGCPWVPVTDSEFI